MRKLIRKFIVWVMGANGPEVSKYAAIEPDQTTSVEAKLRLGIVKAINGTVIEVSTHKHNPHGPDWKHEMYIVRDGEDIAEALRVVLALKALEK